MKIPVRNLQQQRGIGFISLIFIFAVCAVVLLLGLKLVPVYLELFSVKKVMAAMAQGEEVKSGTVTDIRKSFDRRAVIDNIAALQGSDLEITKDAGAPKEAQDLLGSERYFDGKVVSAKDTVVGWRFKGDDPNPLRVPVGIDVNEREMPTGSQNSEQP